MRPVVVVFMRACCVVRMWAGVAVQNADGGWCSDLAGFAGERV